MKENYAIVLDSCYLLIYYKYVEHGMEHDSLSVYSEANFLVAPKYWEALE